MTGNPARGVAAIRGDPQLGLAVGGSAALGIARQLGRRVLHGAWVLLSVSLLCFVLLELAPGDFTDEMRVDPQLSAEAADRLRARYGLDEPLLVRYGRWLTGIVHGDLGVSFAYNLPVARLLRERAGNTLLLTSLAAVLAWALAVPLGVWSAARRHRWDDRLIASSTAVLHSVPDLLLGLGALWLALATGIFPVGGMRSLDGGGHGWLATTRDVAAHLVLPVAALVLSSVPTLVRHVRASMVEVLQAPFIYAARARGLSSRRVLYSHALRAAAGRLAALVGFSIAGLLSTSIVLELILSWPGLGPLIVEATLARDVHVVAGVTTCATLLLVAGMMAADVLTYLADPRVREE